jgi:hypothetical protein
MIVDRPSNVGILPSLNVGKEAPLCDRCSAVAVAATAAVPFSSGCHYLTYSNFGTIEALSHDHSKFQWK